MVAIFVCFFEVEHDVFLVLLPWKDLLVSAAEICLFTTLVVLPRTFAKIILNVCVRTNRGWIFVAVIVHVYIE